MSLPYLCQSVQNHFIVVLPKLDFIFFLKLEM